MGAYPGLPRVPSVVPVMPDESRLVVGAPCTRTRKCIAVCSGRTVHPKPISCDQAIALRGPHHPVSPGWVRGAPSAAVAGICWCCAIIPCVSVDEGFPGIMMWAMNPCRAFLCGGDPVVSIGCTSVFHCIHCGLPALFRSSFFLGDRSS